MKQSLLLLALVSTAFTVHALEKVPEGLSIRLGHGDIWATCYVEHSEGPGQLAFEDNGFSGSEWSVEVGYRVSWLGLTAGTVLERYPRKSGGGTIAKYRFGGEWSNGTWFAGLGLGVGFPQTVSSNVEGWDRKDLAFFYSDLVGGYRFALAPRWSLGLEFRTSVEPFARKYGNSLGEKPTLALASGIGLGAGVSIAYHF